MKYKLPFLKEESQPIADNLISSPNKMVNESDQKEKDIHKQQNKVMKEEKDENDENIWSNKPKSMSECSVNQILRVLDKHIFDGLNENKKEKLINYKGRIIDHVKEKQIDGSALSEMRRIGFIKLFSAHLNDKKVKGALGALYNDLMKYKMPHIKEQPPEKLIISSSKFVTDVALDGSDKKQKEQFYSFGTKFLYNPKLKKSKMFVAAKYKSIKEEFEQHLIDTNKDEDSSDLLEEQMKIINSMEKRLRPLLEEFVNEQEMTSADVLWTGDIETSRKQLKEILSKLCKYVVVSDDDDWDENNSNIAMESVDIAFKVYAIQKIEKQIKMNKDNYIRQQQQNKMKTYIEKCKLKVRMGSVKAMKASKNKSNNDYGIEREQPIGFEHVFALILYSNCTRLCTLFRGTYRFWTNESLKELKKRHSAWANMGKLLYECFLFWASTNSKVAVLFHGMSVELLFARLQCKFNAPTSTTSEESVALGIFAKGGVVMKLESAHSNSKYIKAIDMQLFTCFENEAEFFIFDSELRVNDLKIARINRWIGTVPMNAILLFDLLSNNKFVDNEQLLKEKNQKTLIKILKRIAEGTMETFTNDKYVNTLMEVLITRKKGINFSLSNTQSLIKELSNLFVDPKNCESSPFEIEHSNKNIVVCKLKDKKTWHHIKSALKHEMGPRIARKVIKTAKDLKITNVELPMSKEFKKALYKQKMMTSEIEYIVELIDRSIECATENRVKLNEFEHNVQATDIGELSDNLLIDIFDTIKAHKLITYHFENYTKEQFISAIMKSNYPKEFKQDKNKIIDRFINYDRNRVHFNFYPTWLIADDPFIIFKNFFAASFLINKIRQNPPSKHFKLSMFIIPKKMQSLYDENIIFEHDLKNVQFEKFSKIEIEEKDCNDAQLLMKAIESQLKSLQNDITLIVDRRKSKNTLYIFNGFVDNIVNNNLLGMEFHILSNVVLCYLVKGYGERIRFWPKWIPFIISRFFVRDKKKKNYEQTQDFPSNTQEIEKYLFSQQQKMEPFFWSEKMINKERIVNYLKEQKKQTFSFLAKCHSNEIKNGFGTKLNDETFEKYHHIISGSMHVCVNYDRKYLPFEKYIYAKDNAKVKQANDKTDDDDNKYKRLTASLRSDLEDIDDFPHVMQQISIMNLQSIYERFKQQKRVPAFESLLISIDTYQQSIDEVSVFIKKLAAWIDDEMYDFDALLLDGDEANESTLYMFLSSMQKEEYFVNIRSAIKKIVDQRQAIEQMINLGFYLCKQQLVKPTKFYEFYHWLDGNKIIWQQMVNCIKKEKKESKISKKIIAEFGSEFYAKIESFMIKDREKKQLDVRVSDVRVSVLEWLKWNEQPKFDGFENEILDKVDEDYYNNRLKRQCTAEMVILVDSPWTLKELMSVCLHTNNSDVSYWLRMSFKKKTNTKANYYWLALTLYMAMQYHQRPIDQGKLYKGSKYQTIVNNYCPFRSGPISITSSKDVAIQWADYGVVRTISSSLDNPFRFICGLSVMEISCFPREYEVLLYDSYYPISKTKHTEKGQVNVYNGIDYGKHKKINFFMRQVQYFDEAEFSSDMFYDLIGYEVKEIEGWLQMVKKHELLYEPLTHFPDRLVIHSLRENFDMNEFDIPYSILMARFEQNDDSKWCLQYDKNYIEYFKECEYKIQFDDDNVETIQYDQVFELAANKRQRAKVYLLGGSLFGKRMNLLFEYSKNKQFEEWLIANDYDSDCIEEDITYKEQSYIFQKVDISQFSIICKYMHQMPGHDLDSFPEIMIQEIN